MVVFAYAKVSDPGMDRQSTSLKLDAAQQEMILKVAEAAHAAGNKVAVVLNNDSAVVMEDWIDSVDAILDMYYPGQRGGVATANLLTGKVNPSGKLAFTIPKKDDETILTVSDEAWADWLTVDEGGNTTNFREGILTGYRWYDANGIEPQFDFGYGLSYWNSNQAELTEREDGTKDKWTVAAGTRTLYVGAASDNLILSADIEVG